MTDKEMIGKRIGRNITNLLIEHDMTQLDLAKILDVHKSTVSAWCNGTRIPRMPIVDKMCECFGVRRSRILGEQPAEPPQTNEDLLVRIQDRLTTDPDSRDLVEIMLEVEPDKSKATADLLRRLMAYNSSNSSN